MKKTKIIKGFIVTVFLTAGLIGFSFSQKSERKSPKIVPSPEKLSDAKKEVAGFKKWKKVNDEPYVMWSQVEALCRAPTKEDYKMDKSVHKNKYVNVYVNSTGADEMLGKKNPAFPVGTVIVKEKLPKRDAVDAELLTVMIKREKGFNPEIGDWEFVTLNGAATEVTAQGKLESCQSCHLDYEKNDFVTREYLPQSVERQLK